MGKLSESRWAWSRRAIGTTSVLETVKPVYRIDSGAGFPFLGVSRSREGGESKGVPRTERPVPQERKTGAPY